MQEYAKRLEKEDLKGFIAENKDLGISIFRACIALPGEILQSDGATHLLASQQQTTTVDPVKVFEQNFGLQKNDDGSWADNLQKAAQTWAFIQNVSDLSIDGVKESVETVGERMKLSKEKKQKEKGGDEEGDEEESQRVKQAPMATQAVIAAMALNVGKALSALGNAGSTIFSSVIKRSDLNKYFAKKEVKADDIKAINQILVDGIGKTFGTLLRKGSLPKELNEALDKSIDELGKLNAGELALKLQKGKVEDVEHVVSAFNDAAGKIGTGMAGLLEKFVKNNAAEMKKEAAEYVTNDLKKAMEEAVNPEDAKHKEKFKHDPDWVQSKSGESVCLRCKGETKDVKAFAGLLDMKIDQLKQDEAYFKMAVNLGGMAFDVAANFLAPLAMGGALLRMSKFIFAAVKRWIDFANFCKSKDAMMNAASAYSPAVRGFRQNARKQGAHYSINAACEGVKIVGACLQCSPAVIGGIIAAQAASGVEALEAVLYEIDKRSQLSRAWSTYKQALKNPENRKLGLIAIRKNPTLAKYAIAWGAVVEEDPLVGDFMAYTGISSDTLRGNAHIDKVVDYLEARMPDDITVVGRRYAVKVTLTADSWIEEKARGESEMGVHPVDTTAIESALAGYAEAREKMANDQATPKQIEEAVTEAIRFAKKAKAAVKGYIPKDAKKGGEVEDMVDVKNAFLSKLDIESKALIVKLMELKEEEEKAKSHAPQGQKVANVTN